MIAVCVDPAKVGEVWRHVSDLVRKAYKRQRCLDTFEVTQAKVLRGNALLWLAWDGKEIAGVTITELWKTPAGKVCALLATAGKDLKRWRHLLADIEQFARNEGCALMHFQGRRGWARILPDYEQRIILEKKL